MFSDVFLGALLAFAATSAGAFFVLFFRNAGVREFGFLLSFSAGVMAFSVLELAFGSLAAAGPWVFAGGLALGLVAIFLVELFLPHIHFLISRKRSIPVSKKKAVLLAGTVTIHNVPEGFSIASAFAGSVPLGWVVALSISLQDVAEGFVVSAPLAAYGMRFKKALALGVFSGLVEFLAAVLGFAVLQSFGSFVPFALGFAAGSMAYVILVELVPDAFNAVGKQKGAFFLLMGALVGLFFSHLFI